MDEVSPLEREHSLSVLLPGGMEKNATVHGSKPVMDLLVTLCASYHLNPSDYTVEVLSPNKNNITFKPNSPIGSLEAEKIVLKPKAGEEKIRTPYMPEATVRLLINYNKSHKAVVRVSPRVPLEALLPVVCGKCEFQVESTVLSRDSETKEGLDLTKTLNEHGLREVYARDTAAKESRGYHHLFAASIIPTKVSSSSSLQDLTKKEKKKSVNKGFLSLFRKHRNKSEPTYAVSAPTSPGPTKSRSASVSTQDGALCTTPTADMPKKRRAPQPPLGAFHSFPTNLSSCHSPEPQTSGENTLRSTKRRAPPPPPPPAANQSQKVHDDAATDCLNPLEEEGASVSPSPSPSRALPPTPQGPDPQRPAIQGKDLSDARAALAKVLTASLSSGSLIKRLKNTTNNGASSPDNSTELKSVLNSNMPTKNEFEDPSNNTGLTTFKVVPSRRASDTEPSQDVLAKEEADAETKVEETAIPESETKIAEQVIPEIDQSVTEEDAPDRSESSSQLSCPEEGESSYCPLQPDKQSEDKETAETAKQDDVRPVADLEEESGQSHESVTNEGDLYLGEEEVVKECPTELNACDSNTRDDKTEGIVQEDDNIEGVVQEDDNIEGVVQEDDNVEGVVQEDDNVEGVVQEDDNVEGVVQEDDNVEGIVQNDNTESVVQEDVNIEGVVQEDDNVEGIVQNDNVEGVVQEDVNIEGVVQEDDNIEGVVQEDVNIEGVVQEDVNIEGVVQEDVNIEGVVQEDDNIEGVVQEDDNIEGVVQDVDIEGVVQEDDNIESIVQEDNKTEGDAQEDDDDNFPPPPPPVCFNEYLEEANSGPSVAERARAVTNGHMRSYSEPPQNVHAPGDADKKVSAPSRFAHAVAMAVQRSRLHSTGKNISALLHHET